MQGWAGGKGLEIMTEALIIAAITLGPIIAAAYICLVFWLGFKVSDYFEGAIGFTGYMMVCAGGLISLPAALFLVAVNVLA